MNPYEQPFQTWLKKRDTSPKSIRAYLSDLRQFVDRFEKSNGEPFSLADIDWRDIQDWRDTAEKDFKPATVNRRLSFLRTFFTWAIEQGLASTDPTQKVKGIEQQPLAPKALAEEEVRRILRRGRKDNLRDWAILELLAATGLRVSEAAVLLRSDLELNGKTGWLTVKMGKGKKKRRVPVNEKAADVLKEYLAAENLSPEAPLFSSRLKKPMTSYAIWSLVKKYAAEAGVEGVTPHSFRHTVATRLVRNPNIDLVTAATFLGHSRLDTTARYAQPNADDLEKAAETLE
ncbi:MAG: integrase [Chloroflexi bacterium]|nr:MAG: integrase [Chloroflexota bacterium]